MKKYTVLKVDINTLDELFLNAEGASIINIHNQNQISKEYLQSAVIVFIDLEKAKKFKIKLIKNFEKHVSNAFKFPIVEIETVYSSLWKNANGETEGKFHGYRVIGEIK